MKSRLAICFAGALLSAVAMTGLRAVAEEPAPTLGMIYWVGSGHLARASADGAGVEELVSGLEGPDGVGLDLLRNRVYWTNMARGPHGSIQRAHLDGTPIQGDEKYLIQPGSLTTGKEIELDLAGGKIYWSDRDGKRIQRANLDGTELETLISVFTRPGGEAIPLENPVGMALDIENKKLYFTDRFMGMVLRADMEIPEGETHGTRTYVEILVAGVRDENRPIDIDLDLERGKMYWTDRGSREILRANLDGSGVETLIDASKVEIRSPIGISLERAAGRMYWSDVSTGIIHRANLDGGDIEVIVPEGSIRPLGVEHKMIEPDRGPAAGGQEVGILGSNFAPGRTKVMFGDRESPSVEVVSSSLLIAGTPA
ncbi:IPT/TIG domain-containing protein, partial [Candidatus Sumerlaeota bacterium]|nr:IPT/TIG domain-containing protein [Candidatus Sumerlaeota bacterium]